MTRIVLVNPFDKIPGDRFRDQRYTFLYRKLRERGIDVTWLSSDFHHWSHSRRSPSQLPEELRENIHLVATPAYHRNVGIRRLLSHFILSWRAYTQLKRLPRPDLVLCVGPVEMMYLVARWGRREGVPVIIDVLDLWPDLFVKAFPRGLRWLGRCFFAPSYWLSRKTYALASKVTAVSRTYAGWAERRGRRSDHANFSYYYLGCGDVPVQTQAGTSNTLRCLFAGQFGFNYDVEGLIAAARKLADEGETSIEFVLAGDGSKREALMKQAEGLTNVRFTGWLSTEKLAETASHCHLGLNCYTVEATQSLPTKLFDYMALGLGCVNSLSGEAAELVAAEGVGWQYQAGNAGSLVQLLRHLRKNMDQVIQAGQRARQVFVERFEAERIYDRMIEELLLPAAGHMSSPSPKTAVAAQTC